jgi:hypothetical protein
MRTRRAGRRSSEFQSQGARRGTHRRLRIPSHRVLRAVDERPANLVLGYLVPLRNARICRVSAQSAVRGRSHWGQRQELIFPRRVGATLTL